MKNEVPHDMVPEHLKGDEVPHDKLPPHLKPTTNPTPNNSKLVEESENEQNEPFDMSPMIDILMEIRDNLNNPVASDNGSDIISAEIRDMSAELQGILTKIADKPEAEMPEAEPIEFPDMSEMTEMLKEIRDKQAELIALETERKVEYQKLKDDMQNTVYDIKKDVDGKYHITPIINSSTEYIGKDADYKTTMVH